MRSKILRSVLLAMVASFVLVSAAFADARYAFHPVRIPFIGGGDQFVLPADSGFCSFDVLLAIPPTRNYAILFINPDGTGRILVEGSLNLETTNLESGKTLTWNAGGPGTLTLDANGNLASLAGEGHTAIWGPFPPIQDSGFYVYTGHIDFVNGTVTGHRTDVCAALAG